MFPSSNQLLFALQELLFKHTPIFTVFILRRVFGRVDNTYLSPAGAFVGEGVHPTRLAFFHFQLHSSSRWKVPSPPSSKTASIAFSAASLRRVSAVM